jgi:hypothetical protein
MLLDTELAKTQRGKRTMSLNWIGNKLGETQEKLGQYKINWQRRK